MPIKSETPIRRLMEEISNRFPTASVSLDAPAVAEGTWFLDVDLEGHVVVIQWRSDAGFGLSATGEHAYGEGADEVYQDLEAAYGRVVSLLLSRGSTSQPEPVRLGELRRARGISQVELAGLLNKQQGEISKLERRGDVKLSTMRHAVEKMGGKMTILVTFPDGMERTLRIGEDAIG